MIELSCWLAKVAAVAFVEPALEIPAFDRSSEFYDVEGIPVSLGACSNPDVPACAAWDVSPPCRFDPVFARRAGSVISPRRFREMVVETFAGV